mmetsp:Transcript_153668/g.491362  ORF Transcript_153668/g.491362 Transcript_153668/m.491362 type:complete len:110 (-) Transcript_153668:96-425(-)
MVDDDGGQPASEAAGAGGRLAAPTSSLIRLLGEPVLCEPMRSKAIADRLEEPSDSAADIALELMREEETDNRGESLPNVSCLVNDLVNPGPCEGLNSKSNDRARDISSS